MSMAILLDRGHEMEVGTHETPLDDEVSPYNSRADL
jgi:hypothetical protein